MSGTVPGEKDVVVGDSGGKGVWLGAREMFNIDVVDGGGEVNWRVIAVGFPIENQVVASRGGDIDNSRVVSPCTLVDEGMGSGVEVDPTRWDSDAVGAGIGNWERRRSLSSEGYRGRD